MPGCQELPFDEDRILIRDKKLIGSVSSNPRGYGRWFNSKADTVKEFLLEKAYAQQELPDEEPSHLKKPLKRAVQLIKRYRNIYFEQDPVNSTSSIILTTLAGELYNGEGTIYETVNSIVSNIHNSAVHGVANFKVTNPVNSDEDFTDKWKDEPILFDRFIEFINDFKQAWESINQDANILDYEDNLKSMFGEGILSKARADQNDFFAKAFGSSFVGASNPSKPNPDEFEGLRRLARKSNPYSH
jgi:hypothetical protein